MQMPSPIYQYVINLIVSLPTRRGPRVLMKVSVRKHFNLETRFLDVAKFTTLTLLSLLSLCKLSFPAVGLKISSLPNFLLKSLTEFSYGT
jgi:hypothetical protein